MPNKREVDVAVYGANGYTGRLICQELARHGVSFVMGGRSQDKLETARQEMGLSAPIVVASGEDPGSLESLAAKAHVLISAAGPFGRIGMPVARAAVAAGAHYMDTTGDMRFMIEMADELDAPAKRKKIAMSPAMGFDVVPGDLAAAKAADLLRKGHPGTVISSVDIVYNVLSPAISRGTLKSNLEGKAGEPPITWKDNTWTPFTAFEEVESFTFPHPHTKAHRVRQQLAEALTVSRALKAPTVSTWLFGPRLAIEGLKAMQMVGELLLDSPLKKLMDEAVNLAPEGPNMKQRLKTEYHILAQVHTQDGRTQGVVASGRDPYGFTAEALVAYARLMLKEGYDRKGVISPCQVADPDEAMALIEKAPLTFTVV